MARRSLMPFPGRTGLTPFPADNPFLGFRKEMERLFEGFPLAPDATEEAQNGFLSPRVDLSETETGLRMKADLPGVARDDIRLEIEDGMLTLRAATHREKEERDEDRQYHLVERAHGSFMRRFVLPFAVDEDGVKARHDNGVLTVDLPRAKSAEAARRTIPIGK